jgi:hypothetical protein
LPNNLGIISKSQAEGEKLSLNIAFSFLPEHLKVAFWVEGEGAVNDMELAF